MHSFQRDPADHRVSLTLFAVMFFFVVSPLYADQAGSQSNVSQQEQIRKLEKQLDELEATAVNIRRTLEALKEPNEPGMQPAPETIAEDLTRVEALEPSPTPTPGLAAAAPSPTPDQPTDAIDIVDNSAVPSVSKVFNPDISVIGNFIGKAGEANPFEERSPAALDEVEVALEAFVDPYAKAKFFLSITQEGAEVEEGFINFITLPWELNARVGKMKATFGKVNTLHPHSLPWVDVPLVVSEYLGDEGLIDAGVSVSRLIPIGGNFLLEGTAEIFAGDVEGVFERQQPNDLFYLGHLKLFRDITDNSNIELGGSLARGTAAEAGGARELSGADITYRWKPLERSIYRSFISRTEVFVHGGDAFEEEAGGFYSSADYQFARRWLAGLRLDHVQHLDDPSVSDRGASLTLTFRPSEFSSLRTGFRRTSYAGDVDVNELLFQVLFSIGAHGAHTF